MCFSPCDSSRGLVAGVGRKFRLGLLMAGLAGSSSLGYGQLFAWNFNEAGTTKVENSGTAGPAVMELKDAAGASAALISADGAGVSGKKGDLAFDLSSATGMGASSPLFSGPAGSVSGSEAGLKALSGLKSLTVAGWLRPATPLVAAARIVVTSVFGLQAGSKNQLQFALNRPDGSPLFVNSEANYSDVDTWMFFAVTFDGTQSSDNVKFYMGSPTGTVDAAGTGTIAADQLGTMSGGILVGNNAAKNGIRPFVGLIDNLAIYGAADATGALTQEQIEAVRAASLPKQAGEG